jgi:flagellar biosynthesis protein FlhB
VAEVLAYVFQLRAYSKHGGLRPQVPSEIDVPPQLDPLNPASQKPADKADKHQGATQ